MVGFRLRQVLAALLLAGSAVPFARIGLGNIRVVAAPYLALALVLVITAFGVASTAWWARLVALGWACAAGIAGAHDVFRSAPYGVPMLLMGAVLALSVAGPAMLARFEVGAPPPMTWGQPGMALVRATLITS